MIRFKTYLKVKKKELNHDKTWMKLRGCKKGFKSVNTKRKTKTLYNFTEISFNIQKSGMVFIFLHLINKYFDRELGVGLESSGKLI